MPELQVVIVEDNELAYEQITDFIRMAEGNTSIQTATPKRYKQIASFNSELESGLIKPDIIILDLKFGEDPWEEGLKTLDKRLDMPVVPVIVYSAYSDQMEGGRKYSNILIRAIKKGTEDSGNKLLATLSKFITIKSRLNEFMNDLETEFRVLTLGVIGEIIENGGIDDSGDNVIVALAVSRLLTYLMNASPLIDKSDNPSTPAEMAIVYPPLRKTDDEVMPLISGDILARKVGDTEEIWIIVSPSCDLVQHKDSSNHDQIRRKIRNVMAIRAFVNVASLEAAESDVPKNQDLFANRETIGVFKVPSAVSSSRRLFTSTKIYRTFEFDEILQWTKIASIASPYAEELQSKFGRDVSRIGVPELKPNFKELLKEFKQE